MRIIEGGRRTGKTYAMLNWFLAPGENFNQRLIIVPDTQQRELIHREIRTWCTRNRIPTHVASEVFRRVVAYGMQDAPIQMRNGNVEVWVDNFDMLLHRIFKLYPFGSGQGPIDYTFTTSEPVKLEKIVQPWSGIKEVK